MVQLIDKDAVVAEIERLQDAIKATAIDDRISKEQAEAYKVCVKLRFFVEDTLEVKDVQKEHVSDVLEEAIDEYAPDFSNSIASKAAIDAIRDAFKAGANWQKEQMMKDAVNAKIGSLVDGTIYDVDFNIDSNLKPDDKVKVIIIKSE